MLTPIFRKTIFVSLLSHITAFSVFSFSFGRVLPMAGAGQVNFWGQFLRASQVSPPAAAPKPLKFSRLPRYLPAPIKQAGREDLSLLSGYFLKPLSPALSNREKAPFVNNAPVLPASLKRESPRVIFHPVLPYNFALYFTDRQVAHVELSFKLLPYPAKNTFEIKRKVSSGNLEVDFLCMRYIWHYLFVRQPNLPVDTWQTVKIDLSQKE